MNRKGIITYIDNINHIGKVTFTNYDNNVSPELPVAAHVGNLAINDNVAISYFSSSPEDGLIIAKF